MLSQHYPIPRCPLIHLLPLAVIWAYERYTGRHHVEPPASFHAGNFLDFLRSKGGSYPGDLMTSEETRIAQWAVKQGYVEHHEGAWGSTDYYSIPTPKPTPLWRRLAERLQQP